MYLVVYLSVLVDPNLVALTSLSVPYDRKAQEKVAELALELEESRNRDLASLEQLTMATVQV